MSGISPPDSKHHVGEVDRRPSTETNNASHSRSDSLSAVSAKDRKHHDSEPNPFERSFSGNATKDTGKQTLPGLSNLTSPALNHSGMSHGPGWSSYGSLRNGPLSPAMLLGPSGLGPFDGTLRTGLTPNESSIRTGLTPRGDSSWQLGSPGAMFNHFGGGTGLTPGGNLNFLSGPGGAGINDAMFTRPHQPSHLAQDSGLQNDTIQNSGHDAETAASGLFLLAQHSQQQQQQQSMHPSHDDLMRQAALNSANKAAASRPGPGDGFDISPATGRRGRRKSSFTDHESGPEDSKPSKRGRLSSSQRVSDSGNESDENEGMKNGKPETDEEKRKNFLERNRQAALKCRQRKKQWLQNLQNKVEVFGQENEQLTSQVTSLREEILNLKTMLLAHKDCAVGRGNGNMSGLGAMAPLQY